jgi:hypothetical protein
MNIFLLVDSIGEFYFSFNNFLVDHHRVVIIEGVNSYKHFVEKDTESPPVDGFRMTFVKNNFGREVLRGSAEGVSLSIDDLSKTEVSQLQITVCINQNVFRFQVSIHNILSVQVLEDGYDV